MGGVAWYRIAGLPADASSSVIAEALLGRSRLKLRHRGEERETEHEVSPQRMVHYRDRWTLDAWCHVRDDLRSFALEAIREAAPLTGRAKDVARSDLDEYLEHGHGGYAGRAAEWASLKFSLLAARWASAQAWHSRQRARIEHDGSFVLELPFSESRELVRDILRCGPDVEVIGPPALRRRVAEQLNAAAKRYR